ncbi:MAG: hypothetical protein AABX54_00220 [Nanoarchaeota archaeon]
MELKKTWWLWLILILLLIAIFPKTCGKTDFISTAIEYECLGINAPFINLNTNFSWCYGVCFEKSIADKTGSQAAIQDNNSPAIITEFMSPLLKIFPLLIGIIILILVLQWIGPLRKR